MDKLKQFYKKKINEDNEKLPTSVATRIRNNIVFFGIWTSKTSIFYTIFNFIAKICFYVTIIVQAIDITMARNDSERIFEIYSLFSFVCMATIKLRSMTGNKHQWNQLLLNLTALEEDQKLQKPSTDDYDSDGEDSHGDHESYYEKYTFDYRSLFKIVMKIYFLTLAIFSLSPIAELLYWKVICEKESAQNPHLLYSWTPLDEFGIWGYFVTILVEYIGAFYTVAVHTVFDLMVFGLLILLNGQFQLLRKCTEHIAGNGNGYDITELRDKRARLRIRRCHKTLMILQNSVMDLDKLVKNILGIYFMVAIFTLCSVALRLSVEQMSIMKVASLVQYTSGCLIQLYFFCHYGDMVLRQSSVGVAEGVYASAWWRLSPRVRREVLLLGVGQARVKRLRAGPFNTLDLVSFIQIVRAAYSYYAVISKQSHHK